MPIYDRPTKVLMHEFAADRLKPGQVFKKEDAVQWFKERYPKIKSNTVGMHVEGMAINSPQRKHHPSIRPGAGFDLFYKIESGRFRLWNKDEDGNPKYPGDFANAIDGVLKGNDTEVDEVEPEAAGNGEFAFERDLRNYLEKNLSALEQGLRVYEDEDGEFRGVEFPAGGRYIDILAVDKNGGLVVIELKVSRGYDRTMGQLLRYMAWIKSNLANGKPVRGVIVASEISADLKLAASLVDGIALWQYRLSFELEAVKRN
jgi:endonuclease